MKDGHLMAYITWCVRLLHQQVAQLNVYLTMLLLRTRLQAHHNQRMIEATIPISTDFHGAMVASAPGE